MKGVGITALLYAGPPDFKGPDVIGQLAAWLFHCQMYHCIKLSSSYYYITWQIKGLDLNSSVAFAFGICNYRYEVQRAVTSSEESHH